MYLVLENENKVKQKKNERILYSNTVTQMENDTRKKDPTTATTQKNGNL